MITRISPILALLMLAASMPAVADEVDDLILDLKYGTPDYREEAAISLGEIRDSKGVDPLIEALKDEDEVVRGWAAWSLGEIGDLNAVDPLIKALKDEDEWVRAEAASALGNIGDSKAFDPLIVALNDEDEVVRGRAASALGNIGDPKAVDPLIVALKDDDRVVRWEAASALGNIGDPKAVDPLIVALKDDDSVLRWEAASALGNIGDPKAVDPLIVALKDDDWAVRMRAAEALGNIGDPKAVDPLIVALRDDNSIVRRWAASALGSIGDPKAVDALSYMASRDKDESVKKTAAGALSKLGDPKAVDPPIETHKDYDGVIQSMAAVALGEVQAYDEAILISPENTSTQSNSVFALEMQVCLEKGECQIRLPNSIIPSWLFESTENQKFSYSIDPSSNAAVSGMQISIKYAAQPVYNPTSIEWPMNIWVVQVPGNYSDNDTKLEVCEIVLRSIWDTLYKDDFEGYDYIVWGNLEKKNITTCWSYVCTSDHPAVSGKVNRRHGNRLLDTGYGEGLSEATAYFIDPNYIVVYEYITRGKVLQRSWVQFILVQPLET